MSDASTQSTRTGQLFINGKWVDGRGAETITVINPATEAVIGTVPQATVADVEDAVGAARAAFDEGPWPRMSVRERGAVLRRMAEGFADRYLAMLAAGGTKHHAELLAPFGLDARDPAFWQSGLGVIERMIAELEGLD